MSGNAAQAHPGYNEGDPNVLDFTTPDKGTNARPWQQMTLDGHPVMVRQPKNSFWLGMAERMTDEDPMTQMAAANEFLFTVFDEASREHIKARLDDDEDDFDVDELGEVLTKLQGVWGKDRGGSRSGSQGSSRGRTTRSTARRR